jgi:hypothetical protein
MSRKDYILIVQVLKETKASQETIKQMASKLATTNPLFNKDRFIKASTYEKVLV